MATYCKVKLYPASKYGDVTDADLGIRCTCCYAGGKIFESTRGRLIIAEHYNPAVHYVTVEGVVDGEKVFKAFENVSYGLLRGCDYARDLLKVEDWQPTEIPVYEY